MLFSSIYHFFFKKKEKPELKQFNIYNPQLKKKEKKENTFLYWYLFFIKYYYFIISNLHVIYIQF